MADAAAAPSPAAPVDSTDSKTIKLQSTEGTVFDTTWALAKKSNTVKNLVENMGILDSEAEPTPIPLPNVSGADLTKVLAWLDHHKDEAEPEGDKENSPGDRNMELPEWDKNFFNLDQSEIFQIILAANYLDIKRLLDFGCKTIANMIKGKSAQEIRDTFNIVNDFTEAEEEQIKKENAWCDE